MSNEVNNSRKPWTSTEHKFLINNYSTQGAKFCANYLGRSRAAITEQARKFKLKVKKETLSAMGKSRVFKRHILDRAVLEEEYIKNKKPMRDIALLLNSSVDIVKKNLDEYGIPRRTYKWFRGNMVGLKFGDWLVLEENKKDKANRTLWLCRCKCNKTFYVDKTNLVTGVE